MNSIKKYVKLILRPEILYERLLLRVSEYLAQKYKVRTRAARLKGTLAARLHFAYTGSLELIEIVSRDKPQVIYDVGAHIGTWSLLAKSCIPNSAIHAFEPIDSHIVKFRESMKGISYATLHQIALGDRSDRLKINITNRSDSSSLLEPTKLAEEYYGVRKETEQIVRVVPLDEYISKNDIPLPDFIKLDVQGYELEVLKGGQKCLFHAKWVLCEVSFHPFYKDQPLFCDVASFLNDHGYNVYAFGKDTPLGAECAQTEVLFRHQSFLWQSNQKP